MFRECVLWWVGLSLRFRGFGELTGWLAVVDVETKTVPLRKMKAAASLDLSDPSQLTMKEIIRRAEAIERAVCFFHTEKELARRSSVGERILFFLVLFCFGFVFGCLCSCW